MQTIAQAIEGLQQAEIYSHLEYERLQAKLGDSNQIDYTALVGAVMELYQTRISEYLNRAVSGNSKTATGCEGRFICPR